MQINSVDDYIKAFPVDVQIVLKQIQETVKTLAPQAVESISYGMPGYKTNGKPLVYFAAYKKHIGLYATPVAHIKFEKQLSKYKRGKGSVQFPLDAPLPLKLISDIVKFKSKENKLKN